MTPIDAGVREAASASPPWAAAVVVRLAGSRTHRYVSLPRSAPLLCAFGHDESSRLASADGVLLPLHCPAGPLVDALGRSPLELSVLEDSAGWHAQTSAAAAEESFSSSLKQSHCLAHAGTLVGAARQAPRLHAEGAWLAAQGGDITLWESRDLSLHSGPAVPCRFIAASCCVASAIPLQGSAAQQLPGLERALCVVARAIAPGTTLRACVSQFFESPPAAPLCAPSEQSVEVVMHGVGCDAVPQLLDASVGVLLAQLGHPDGYLYIALKLRPNANAKQK